MPTAPDDERSPRRRTILIRLLVVPLLAALGLGAWALASPVGSSPDDDFHLASIWCGLGERDGLCESTGDSETRAVPAGVALAAHCYAFRPDESAACQDDLVESAGGALQSTDRGNFRGQYPGGFYAVLGIFASPAIEVSVVVMRLVNVLLFVGLTTVAFHLLPRRRAASLLWPWLVTTVPLGVFVIASTNPSSWTVISAGTLWIALVGFLEAETRRRRIGLGVVAAVAAAMGVASRPDAIVFTMIAIVVALVLALQRSHVRLPLLILPAAIAALAVVVFLTGNPAGVAGGQLGGGDAPLENPLSLLLGNLLNVPLLWAGVFGSWNLGWLDTQLPGVVGVALLVVFAGIAFGGLQSMDRRKLVALVGIGVALWAIPTYVLVQSRAFVGAEVQPRYLLPLIVMLGGVAVFAAGARAPLVTRFQGLLVAVVVAAAHAIALHFQIRRYVTGMDGMAVDLGAGAEWWWPVAPPPTLLWFLGAAAFAAAVVLATRALTRSTYPTGVPTP